MQLSVTTRVVVVLVSDTRHIFNPKCWWYTSTWLVIYLWLQIIMICFCG